MSRAKSYHSQGGSFRGLCGSYFNRNHSTVTAASDFDNYNTSNYNDFHRNPRKLKEYNCNLNYVKRDGGPSSKRRKFSASAFEESGRHYQPEQSHSGLSTCGNDLVCLDPSRLDANAYMSSSSKRGRSKFEDDDDVFFMSRDEIERCSPSRKDGIDVLHETKLRYSYCAFLQDLGLRLNLPQTTIGTAMVLCHRFFVRRSHACHNRFLIATAALFLAAKSEETLQPLNNVLRASCEIFHSQELTYLSFMLSVNWFEHYRERVIEAEQLILTTLDFELNVQHPYSPLTSILGKLGFSRSILATLALDFISKGLRSSLWLQFKPHQIAAGATYLAVKYLNMDLASFQNIWMEFETPPSILEDVARQLEELF